MAQTLVIYHGGCRDGFCAAWVHNKYYYGESYDKDYDNPPIYFPGHYGQPPPDVMGKDVVILDFCYPIDIMKQIMKDAKSFLWIDHHKTALEFHQFLLIYKLGDYKWNFDISRSGAGITWDYFFHGQPRPWLVGYVEDRDLWAKKLPGSDEINAYIACLEFDFKVWDDASKEHVDDIAEYAKVAMMKTEQYVREVCKNAYFTSFSEKKPTLEILEAILNNTRKHDYCDIPTVNICQVDCSEVLHELCKKHPESPFSLYWFKRHDGMYQYGLRSIGDFDVSNVAKLFGGGGHKNAAGFQLNYLLEELK